MHPLFDERLTDPTEAAVRAALKRACAAANGRRKTGTVNLNDQNLRSLGKLAAGERDGLYTDRVPYCATDTVRLVLAWWTAPGGRKLVRVRTWREPWQEWSAGSTRIAEARAFDARPPV